MKYTKITFKIKDTKKPHFFIGSKIRGTLGYALKDEVCINPTFKCNGCFAQHQCIFYDMYEKQNNTHKYRFDFDLYNNNYKFSLFLFEDHMAYQETLTKAILETLKEHKVVKHKIKQKKFKQKEKYSKIIKLNFITPVRIKKQNKFLLDNIGLNDILYSIHRRDLELRNQPFKRIAFNQDIKVVSKNIRYQEITRKSNKQNTKMNLGGLMGEIVLSNVDKQTYNLLKLGEIISIGKQTVFGLGKIKIEDIK